MQKYFAIIVCLLSFSVHAQFMNPGNNNLSVNGDDKPENNEKESLRGGVKKDSVAPIRDYKIISIKNDTIAVDTALSIKKYYTLNYLRRDDFGLLPFNNEGQTYQSLKFNSRANQILPDFGFTGRQFGYLNVEDIKYYSVPTPYTDLYYKSVMKQGQNLDAFITLNTSENLNFFIGYKGLRSVGKYINQLTSAGNFKIGASYYSPNKKYLLRTHFTMQDILNEENGGIRDLDLFKESKKPYNKRERLNVYFRDMETMLKGKRIFLNHQYQLNNSFENGILLTHEFVYEDKFYEFKQDNIGNIYDDQFRFGDAFQSSIRNKTKYYRLYNRVGAAYQSELLGRFEFFTDFHRYKYDYNSIAHIGGKIIPDEISKNITMVGGKYIYRKDNWRANLLLSSSLGNDNTRNIEVNLRYELNEEASLDFSYQNLSRMGNLSYYLYQSDYVNYNWNNNWNNEKVNQFDVTLNTPWVNLSGSYSTLKDKLYFSNNITSYNDFGIPDQVLVTPKQYGNTINYISLQASKDIHFGRFGLDNTILYQNVDQKDNIVNVPKFLTRNTFYYTDAFFDNALKFQTGITFKYFSKYYGDDYNPLLGDFFVQDKVKIGDYPVFDFFINMKVRTARIYIILEHFNSSMSGYNYYTAPNYPYKDFMLRFGLVWNFFS
ncbi:putative porin [Myroides injenensis]|uniref:putative porin n=1 Tax=Myroides injenensis TaxID=1183151 RepID=UPI00226E8C30|nr:putative porin [Myroides injenensis]